MAEDKSFHSSSGIHSKEGSTQPGVIHDPWRFPFLKRNSFEGREQRRTNAQEQRPLPFLKRNSFEGRGLPPAVEVSCFQPFPFLKRNSFEGRHNDWEEYTMQPKVVSIPQAEFIRRKNLRHWHSCPIERFHSSSGIHSKEAIKPKEEVNVCWVSIPQAELIRRKNVMRFYLESFSKVSIPQAEFIRRKL